MISSRFVLPVMILVFIALVPTVIHNYLGLVQDYGVSVAKIDSVLGEFNSRPSKRNQGWGEETFGSYDWIERIYENSEGKAVRLFVAKSYDHKRLFHHPELALSYGKDLSSNGMHVLKGHIDIPVNLLKNNNQTGVVAYALLSEGKYVENPILHTISNALNLLVNPRKPLILFYVSDERQLNDVPFSETMAANVLQKSIADFTRKNEASNRSKI